MSLTVIDFATLYRYGEEGHTIGTPELTPNPIRLEWDFSIPVCMTLIYHI